MADRGILLSTLLFLSLSIGNNLFAENNIEINIGCKAGYKLIFYDDAGDSFKMKNMHGLGFNHFLQVLYGNYLGVEIETGGFFYCGKSEDNGGYYYPKTIEIPFSVMVKGFLPIGGFSSGEGRRAMFVCRLNAGIGCAFPYLIRGSYYSPAAIVPGIVGEIGCDFFPGKTRIAIGPSIKGIYYFDVNADKHFSINCLISVVYKLF
jgi:hypothetical protein